MNRVASIPSDTLRSLRERLGLSQAEVARRMGVSRQRIVAIEGQTGVTQDTTRRYLDALEQAPIAAAQ